MYLFLSLLHSHIISITLLSSVLLRNPVLVFLVPIFMFQSIFPWYQDRLTNHPVGSSSDFQLPIYFFSDCVRLTQEICGEKEDSFALSLCPEILNKFLMWFWCKRSLDLQPVGEWGIYNNWVTSQTLKLISLTHIQIHTQNHPKAPYVMLYSSFYKKDNEAWRD